MRAEADGGNRTAKCVLHFLNNCRVYHFHDTSSTATSYSSSVMSVTTGHSWRMAETWPRTFTVYKTKIKATPTNESSARYA